MRKHFKLNNLKKVLYILTAMCFAFITSCDRFTKKAENVQETTTASSPEIYYCPMHPEVQQDHPGICPKPECDGMDLVKKRSPDLLHALLKPLNSTVVADINTIHPEEKNMPINIAVKGFIDYDNRTKHNIASRFEGRIEKLYIRYNYQPVALGERIFDIYSPDLVTAQENYLYLLNTDPNEVNLMQAATQRLRLLGFTDEQLNALAKNKMVIHSVPVYSRWAGHIHESMTETNKNTIQNTTELQIKEGMYVSAGETVFNVVDPHAVVIQLQLKDQDIAQVKVNDQVTYTVDETPPMTMHGKINFIEPILQQGAKTIKARVDLTNNEHTHKVGALVNATIQGKAIEGLWIPAKSVVDLGKEKIVWVKKEHYFKAQKISTGISSNGYYQVIQGLYASDEIAVEAAYLSDSESFIKITEDEDDE